MPTILGVNCGREFFWGGGGPEILEKQGRKLRGNNLPSKFAEKFAGYYPKIRHAKIKKSPQIRSAEPQAQELRPACTQRYFKKEVFENHVEIVLSDRELVKTKKFKIRVFQQTTASK